MSLILQYENFIELLGGIAKKWCLSKDFEIEFMNMGIDFNHWPECEPKSVLKEFSFFAETKGRDFSFSMLAQKYLKFDDSILPEPIEALPDLYASNLKHFRAKELALNIMKNPMDVDNLLFKFQTTKTSNVSLTDADDLLPTIQEIEKMIRENKTISVIKGFEKLSKAIGGFNSGRLSLVGANSGFGKTKFAINLGIAAQNTMNVLFFNMEMTPFDFKNQIIQSIAGLSQSSIYAGSLMFEHNQNKILNYVSKEKFQFKISDGTSLSKTNIISKIFAFANGVDQNLVIIDYDQKIMVQSRNDEWKEMLNTFVELEDCAKRTNSHVVILYQADDSGDVKASKRAKQPASSVLSFHSDGGKFFIRSLKNRFGERFKLQVEYNPSTTTLREIDFVDYELNLDVENFLKGKKR